MTISSVMPSLGATLPCRVPAEQSEAQQPAEQYTAARHDHQERQKIDFTSVPNTRTAAMLPIMDAGVQLAFSSALAAVSHGATAATISVVGHLAHHKVDMSYRLDATGLHGEGTIGGVRLQDNLLQGTTPQGTGVAIDGTVGDTTVRGEGHVHGDTIHVDGQVGRIPAHLTMAPGTDGFSLAMRGTLNQSQVVQDLQITEHPEAGTATMIATGRIGNRKLEREYLISVVEGGLDIEARGRLGRGNPTDLHIEVRAES